MKQVFLSALFLVSVGAASGYACDDSSGDSAATAQPRGPHHNPALRAAMESCASANNLTRPQPGQPPSNADRATMDACLKTKGFSPPGPPPPAQAAAATSDSN